MAAANKTNIKLCYINGLGPVIGIIQHETQDSITLMNVAIFGTDEKGDIIMDDYMGQVSDPNKETIFYKYNVVSVSEPAAYLLNVYVDTVKKLSADEPKILVPDNKIIR